MNNNTIKALKQQASWGRAAIQVKRDEHPEEADRTGSRVSATERDGDVGIHLSYTINLNLPPTPDIAVFNAIFKALRENLLR
jgi:hypothetical protein